MKKLVKHAGGRPTKYNPTIINPLIEEYLNSCSSENAKLPTVEGLALKLNVNRDSLYEWATKYPEFSDTIKKVGTMQQEILIQAGFFGGREVNGSMGIFLLKALHGLKDNSNSVNVQVNVQPILGEMTAE